MAFFNLLSFGAISGRIGLSNDSNTFKYIIHKYECRCEPFLGSRHHWHCRRHVENWLTTEAFLANFLAVWTKNCSWVTCKNSPTAGEQAIAKPATHKIIALPYFIATAVFIFVHFDCHPANLFFCSFIYFNFFDFVISIIDC